jgi:hypothetical protein
METAIIAIGRGVGEAEMEHLKWHFFISDLTGLVKKLGGRIHTEAHGTGYWEGQIEDSYIINFAGADLRALAAALPHLAHEYEQACIALIVGTCELVSTWTS